MNNSGNETEPKRLRRSEAVARATALVAWGLLMGYWVALAVGTHLPPETAMVIAPDSSDKALHAGAYCGLAVLAALAWRMTVGSFHLPAGVTLMIALTSFATLDELTQPYFNRNCELNDWFADLVGGAIGLVLFRIVLAVCDACRQRSRRRAVAAVD